MDRFIPVQGKQYLITLRCQFLKAGKNLIKGGGVCVGVDAKLEDDDD